MLRSLPISIRLIPGILLFVLPVWGQDQIFLKQDNEVIYCYIVHADDSIIVFRSAEPTDTTLYEISYLKTDGFLLEVPEEKEGGVRGPELQLRVFHQEKKRHHIYRENNGIVFRNKNDSPELVRRGRITRITVDSLEIETKIHNRKDRYTFANNQVEMFGYTNALTEILSVIVFPLPSGKNEADFFYRKLPLSKGWRYTVTLAPAKKMRKHRKWKKINMRGGVRVISR